jgi:hypothetical protein
MSGVMSATSLRDSYVRLCSAMFWLLLLWCAFDAHLFIATNASNIFFADDTTLIDGLHAREGGWFGHWLMALHNEHREPLPKLLWFPLYILTDDIRSGMHAQVRCETARSRGSRGSVLPAGIPPDRQSRESADGLPTVHRRACAAGDVRDLGVDSSMH